MKYLNKITQPSSEPVTLAEAQLHLRLDTVGSPPSHPDDTIVQALISASRENAEQYSGVTIAACTYEMQGELLDDALSLQTYPVTSIVSVKYQDEDDVTQTVSASDYYVNNFERPARLVFKDNAPTATLTVQFSAGFTDGQSPNTYPLPAGIKASILLLLGHLYENRESVTAESMTDLPMGYLYLMTPHRINMGL
jgi:uncharacterized phiE125 gp8 family phage protein